MKWLVQIILEFVFFCNKTNVLFVEEDICASCYSTNLEVDEDDDFEKSDYPSSKCEDRGGEDASN